MLGYGRRFSAVLSVGMFAAALVSMVAMTMTPRAVAAADPALDAMKARLSSTAVGDRPRLCLQIAEHQLAETDKLYAASDVDNAQTTLTDVVAYSELARDYAIQSHKYQKQTEIAVRAMARRLTELVHVLAHDDQAPVREAINRLQRVRDDLLAAMFKKGAK
jgi:hypothetical protein